MKEQTLPCVLPLHWYWIENSRGQGDEICLTGVVLTHQDVLSYGAAIKRTARCDSNSCSTLWLCRTFITLALTQIHMVWKEIEEKKVNLKQHTVHPKSEMNTNISHCLVKSPDLSSDELEMKRTQYKRRWTLLQKLWLLHLHTTQGKTNYKWIAAVPC